MCGLMTISASFLIALTILSSTNLHAYVIDRNCKMIETSVLKCNVDSVPTSIPAGVTDVILERLDLHWSVTVKPFNYTSWAVVLYLEIHCCSFCGDHSLNYEAFYGLRNIRHLNLKCLDSLSIISPNSFRGLDRLEKLDLSDNSALEVKSLLDELSRVACNNQTTLPSLRWLNMAKVQSYSNTPVALDGRFFQILSKREIEYLDLSHFYINELDMIAFGKLCGHLNHLVLKNASIITNKLPTLVQFNGNLIRASCPSLRTLDIRNMNFGYLMQFMKRMPDYYKTSRVFMLIFIPYLFHLFPNVETLFMRNVLHKDQLGETNLTGHVFNFNKYEFAFHTIDFSNNNLRLFNVSVVLHPNTSKSLNETDFSGNVLVYISPKAFHSSIYIQHLNLSGNNLNEMLKHHHSDFEILLNPLRKLKVFSLSNNGLTTLPKNMFTNNSELRYLDLSDNFLIQIDFKFKHLIKLQILDLGGNRFRVLNVDMFLQCENILQYQNDTNSISYNAGDSKLHVILHKNPMECKCDDIFIRSVEWIENSGFVRNDELLPVCSVDNKEFVISKTASQKTKDYCRRIEVLRIVLIVGIVSASILVVCVIIVIILRRRLNKKNALERFEKKIKVGDKLKNLIFLSFCNEDGDYVLENIYPRMKEEASLALECDRNLVCCGEFNFKPGVSVCIEAMRCIEESAVIIFVVFKKKHFVRKAGA